MATVYDYSLLSQAVYEASKETVQAKGKVIWRRKGVPKSEAGFFAAVFVCDNSKEAVIAFRGTDDFNDVINDVAIVQGNPPLQASIGLEFAKATKSQYSKLSLTGHSLGGAIAILVANQLNLKAYTFNAPGVAGECMSFSVKQQFAQKSLKLGELAKRVSSCLSNPNIKNVRVNGDPVSSFFTTGFQTGESTTIQAQECSAFDVKCMHSIDTIVVKLKNGV